MLIKDRFLIDETIEWKVIPKEKKDYKLHFVAWVSWDLNLEISILRFKRCQPQNNDEFVWLSIKLACEKKWSKNTNEHFLGSCDQLQID